MKVLAFRPRRPSRAEILRRVRDARCGPALAGMKRRAIPAGSRAKVGAGRRGDSAGDPRKRGADRIGRPAVNRTAVIRPRETRTTRRPYGAVRLSRGKVPASDGRLGRGPSDRQNPNDAPRDPPPRSGVNVPQALDPVRLSATGVSAQSVASRTPPAIRPIPGVLVKARILKRHQVATLHLSLPAQILPSRPSRLPRRSCSRRACVIARSKLMPFSTANACARSSVSFSAMTR